MLKEFLRSTLPGGPVVLFVLAAFAASFTAIGIGAQHDAAEPALVVLGVAGALLAFLTVFGLFIVNPNEARVLQLFGDYKGSAREPGLRWANPLYAKRPVSLRVVSF